MYLKQRTPNHKQGSRHGGIALRGLPHRVWKILASASATVALVLTLVAPAQAEEALEVPAAPVAETGSEAAQESLPEAPQEVVAEVPSQPPAELASPAPEPVIEEPPLEEPQPELETQVVSEQPAAATLDADDTEMPSEPQAATPEMHTSPTPALRWKAVEADGSLATGMTFEVEGPRPLGIPAGDDLTADVRAVITDNTGQAGYDGEDLDPTPGLFTVEQLVHHTNSATTHAIEEDDLFRIRSTETTDGDANGEAEAWQNLEPTTSNVENPVGVLVPATDDTSAEKTVADKPITGAEEEAAEVPNDHATDGSGSDAPAAPLSSGDFSILADFGIMAAPVTIPISPIQAQMANHSGWTGANGNQSTSPGNCIRYGRNSLQGNGNITVTGSASNAEGNDGSYYHYTNGNTAWSDTTNTVWSAHGRSGNNCPEVGAVNIGGQSALGFNPSAVSSIETGTVFNLGRMVHSNNPINATNGWFRGDIKIRFMGTDMSFRWRLHETDNYASETTDPLNNDILDFLNQTTEETFVSNGITYTLVVHGFTAPNSGTQKCTETLTGEVNPINQFSTVETSRTYACLWASVEQVRPVTVKKLVESPYATAPQQSFNFTTTSSLAGSYWSAPGNATLAHNGEFTRPYNTGETITVTEGALPSGWEFTSVQCVDGTGNPVTSATYSGTTITIPRGSAAETAEEAPITCTYTNTYAPKATLTLVKNVISTGQSAPVAVPADWTLTAQGQGLVSSQVVTGPGNSADVTSKTVIAGTYQLSELATNPATTAGYVQDGPWQCTGGVTVTADGTITLSHGTTTTCTVTNRYQIGELQIAKAYDTEVPSGTTNTTFSGTYECLLGNLVVATGTWTVLGTGSATLVPSAGSTAASAIPVGAICSATETAPAAGLGLPAGYIWGEATVGDPVTIANQTAQTITVTNTAERRSGELLWTKVDDGGEKLSGSEWTLTGPGDPGFALEITDCVAANDSDCTGPDQDSRAGYFSIQDLEWGTYTLTETRAPAGFVLPQTTYTFTISGSALSGTIPGVSDNEIVNERRDGLTIPLTGGLGRDFYSALGLGVLILGAGALGTLLIRNRRKEVA